MSIVCHRYLHCGTKNELMTGYLSAGDNPLSRLSIATLQDLGYSVDYSQADPYTASNMDPGCVCNRRRLGQSHAQRMTPKRRKLSKEGEQAAIAYGEALLSNVDTQEVESNSEVALDLTVFVMYAEGDQIHGVHVVPDENGGYRLR